MKRRAGAAAAAASGIVIFAAVCTAGRGSFQGVELQGGQGFPSIKTRDHHGWAPSPQAGVGGAQPGEDTIKEGGEEVYDENGEMTPEHQVVHGIFLDVLHHLLYLVPQSSLPPSLPASLPLHILFSLSIPGEDACRVG
jgi:hypothetical protein